MTKSVMFGKLLSEAVIRIGLREDKSLQAVQDELGHALNRENGSPIEYWRRGNPPASWTDLEQLAREIVRRSDLDRVWLERFLRSAQYGRVRELCDELRPLELRRDDQARRLGATGEARAQPATLLLTPAPFVTGPPITNCSQFFGRAAELRRIFGSLRHSPLQNVAIIGKRRSGKTSLLHYIRQITTASRQQLRPGQRMDWLVQPERYCWVFVDFQDARMVRREWLMRYLLAQLHLPVPEPCTLIDFMNTVSNHLEMPTVLLFDEIGAALAAPELDMEFWWSLRSLGTNQTAGRLAFILTAHRPPDEEASSYGKPSPFFNIFLRLDLGPLSEPEARELIASSPVAVDPADVAWMLEQSACWPAALQALCQAYLASRSDESERHTWRADALRLMQPFRHLME